MADPQLARKSQRNVAELTVSELASGIKRTLEDSYGHVRLRGEVSGYRGAHSSGHCYFSLKDDKAKIDAVVWRGVFQSLRFKPEEGLEVIVTGKVTTYPGSSKYQIVVESLEPAGAGALMALLEERKRKLAAEGLFDEARKKPLPFLPAVVGIVTSPTGAVIRDMLHGFAERFPTRVVVWPVRVQGESSAGEVAAAVRGFNALDAGGAIPRPDLLIVARGGGSLEDLWGFNEEIVVRAVAESAIPVISAVGHETDWTLIDLVADARAPTPTKAAEWAVPKHSELMERMAELAGRLRLAARRRLEGERQALTGLARALPRPLDLVMLPRQRLDGASGRLPRALSANIQAHANRFARLSGRFAPGLVTVRLARAGDRLETLRRFAAQSLSHMAEQRRARLERASVRLKPQTVLAELRRSGVRVAELEGRARIAIDGLIGQRRRLIEGQAQMLRSLSYQSVLGRGFAIVRDGASGKMVRAATATTVGQALEIELADGRVGARVTGGEGSRPPREAEGATPGPAREKPKRSPGGGQGSLF
ncbi:MAG: exodeoxyribonuclease VII large subunit [Hyphomicrobiaceae bacterium]